MDLGWVAEYNYDCRGSAAPVSTEQDIVVGTRWTLNDAADSKALMVMSVDTKTGEQLWTLEAS